jgi:6-phosphogluconolactonase (cycloisomerase 2 family)
MEIKLRMSKRFAWLLGLLGLLSIGLLVACGSKYNSSSDGLVLVGSQGSAVIETFSFSLSNGHISEVSNPPATNGQPFAMVLDPAGRFAYVASTVNCTPSLTGNPNFTNVSVIGAVQAAITAYKVNSDGTLSAKGSAQYLPGNPSYPPDFPTCGLDDSTNPNAGNQVTALFMDAAGKFLFVASQPGAVTYSYTENSVNNSFTATLPSTVQVLSIGADGTLTAVPGTFTFPGTLQAPSFAALAATPTVFPAIGPNGIQNAVCSDLGNNPPTSEFLYVADSVNDVVWEFGVDTSSGTLKNPPGFSTVQSFPAGAVPSGVAVDPCDRFVYVSNKQSNTINAYTICNGLSTQASSCPALQGGDGTLVDVTGSPFSLSASANGPGPMVVDPYGNYVYVLDTLSNQISPFHISPVSGSLTAGTLVVTGVQPTSIAIRGDDNWLFVTNFASGTTGGLSQYAITPATGTLSALPAVVTDNNPWGVAVK